MIVIVYRAMVWVFIDPPFTAQVAVSTPVNIHSLIEALTQAVTHARGDKQS